MKFIKINLLIKGEDEEIIEAFEYENLITNLKKIFEFVWKKDAQVVIELEKFSEDDDIVLNVFPAPATKEPKEMLLSLREVKDPNKDSNNDSRTVNSSEYSQAKYGGHSPKGDNETKFKLLTKSTNYYKLIELKSSLESVISQMVWTII